LEGPNRVITRESAADVLSRLGFVGARTTGEAPKDLMNLSGVEFEHFIKSLLDRLGFKTEMTAATGDGGIDIVAHLDQPIVGGKYLVQCKRYLQGTLVGASTVREFYGGVVADPTAVKGILITTSDFTSQARVFAAGLRIELVGGGQLQELLKSTPRVTNVLPFNDATPEA
jgi:restriction system protein